MVVKVPKINLRKLKKKQYDPSKQVEGLKKRLEGSGIDSKKATDKRNFIEKALNLTPDQNFLFDIFEILERPQRTLFGAIDAAQQGKDIGKGALAGLTGEEEVRFNQILHNAGMEDSKEKFGVDDVLGFAGEILLDPMNFPILPAKGSASAVTKATKSLTDANKALDVARTAGKVEDIAKATSKLKDAQKALKTAQKASRKRSGLDMIFSGIKQVGGKTVKFTDNSVSKLLTKIDKISLDKASELGKAKDALKLAEGYTNFKHRIAQIFDAAKSLPEGIWEKAKQVIGSENISKAKLGVLNTEINTKIDDVAKKLGKSSDELGKELQGFIEYKYYRPKGSVIDALGNPKQALDEPFAHIANEIFQHYGYDFDKAYKKVTLDNGVNAFIVKDDSLREKVFSKVLNDDLDLIKRRAKDQALLGLKDKGKTSWVDLAGKKLDMPRFYNLEQREMYDLLYMDKDFKELADFAYDTQRSMLDILDDAFGTISEGASTTFDNLSEGVIHHTRTEPYSEVPIIAKPFQDDLVGSSFKGNVNTFTGRKYQMSAEEANMVARQHINNMLETQKLPEEVRAFWEKGTNIDMFEETLQASMGDFIVEAPKFAKHTKMMDEALVRGFLSNPDLIRGKVKGTKIPRGYREVSRKDLVAKLTNMSKYLENPNAMNAAKALLPKEASLVVDENIFRLVGTLGNPKETGMLTKFINTMNNWFKKNKLLSPGFQMRNIVGNTTNMYLAGMPVNDIAKYGKYADEILRKGDDVLQKMTLGGKLTAKERKIYDIYEEFIRNGFHEAASDLWEIPESVLKKAGKKKKNALNKAQEINNYMNEAMDKRFRLSMMMYAKDNPAILAKNGVNSPYELVRRALFDPKDLSAVEREYARKIIPFYTFSKKNLAFQMKNSMTNPQQYRNLKKTMSSLWDSQGINDKDLEDYKREDMWIPVPGLTKDGKYVALKVNLPVGELAEFVDDPLKRVVSSVAPVARAPFELVGNKQLFTGMPISDFKGQRGYRIPEIDRKLEYGLSQIGMDVPVSTVMDVGRTAVQGAKGDLRGSSILDILHQAGGRSVASKGSVEQAQRSKSFDELRELEDLIAYYKQEGVDIKTIPEINNKNKVLKNMKNRIRSLNR